MSSLRPQKAIAARAPLRLNPRMIHSFSRRFFLGSGIAALAGCAQAGAPAVSLRPQLRPGDLGQLPDASKLIEAARLGGDVGFAVIDMTTGQVLEAREGTRGFPPASVTKAITALYALDALGPTYRFRTQLVATGPVSNGIIQGDLVLVGGGDPVLDTDALGDMAANLRAAGVRGVTGAFRVYGGALPYERVIDRSQPDQVGYNPALSGLSLNFNRVHFQWERGSGGYAVTMDARSSRFRPEVQVARMRIADRAAPLYTYTDGGDHDQWSVARGALGKSGSRWLPVRRPANYAGEVFASLARAQGITLGPALTQQGAPGGTALVSHFSDPLPQLLTGMLKFSNNLTAELIGMTATRARMGGVASLAASAREMTGWAQRDLGLEGARLVDHSGLGDASRVSALSLAKVLTLAHRSAALRPMLKPFRMRGSNGSFDDKHPVRVEAKTGTLHFVSALAGYATGPSGRPLAFAIFTQEPARRAAIAGMQSDSPPGGADWNRRAKGLQQALIERWSAAYGG
ncbi:D-alanyl-D-alanine carboxypeptidase / D-alanyl-D-alanine-endopeptidase (penicillin-binding protein 4) [Roseovarius nanhaiticus]|uniref:D-alanyl-D-alanine carboxypeptidase / D-alanyl-D-alanine-endopeptidase (Penicillin-binding protein 4) n=2 Tax=Roseovarius nanhaiticus TaxID=573024 RepID=A0A1N7FL09_9RHOB|nr:D-alanyl-D-alanine carboxypeptidase / D-alanyl-D-alanine-endopeptidase (penicillin-binding protein 4) [Roseovarius nanhaiticus]SIS00945.1 D-alanyl-D-alanine carboxypeptidase / D-alanyl-D-alanine-endopeptidase (penicillin-binding protein 4) [Roseovarius nanhaiticus]